jgi:hypothetical protein
MKSLSHSEDRNGLLARIASLRPDSQRRWGSMSGHQMICHLNDSFLGCMGERQISSATGMFQRTVIKFAALYAPLKWPKGVPTRPEVEQGVGGTTPIEFEHDRSALTKTMERFWSPDCADSRSPHPIFGHMRDQQWLRWGYLHVDHHLRQFGL